MTTPYRAAAEVEREPPPPPGRWRGRFEPHGEELEDLAVGLAARPPEDAVSARPHSFLLTVLGAVLGVAFVFFSYLLMR